MLAKLASVDAHRFLAKLIDLGAIPPNSEVTAVARDEEHGLQIVVSVTRYEGPVRVHADVLDKIAAMNASQERPKCPSATPHESREMSEKTVTEDSPPSAAPPPRVLRDVDQAALTAAPLPVALPVTVKALARAAGYAYNSHFREAVRRLVDAGLLARVTGGVRRAA